MSKLENPYESGFGRYGALSPTGHDIARASWEEGARAVIERLRVDAFLLRRAKLQEPIQKLADEYDSELAAAGKEGA